MLTKYQLEIVLNVFLMAKDLKDFKKNAGNLFPSVELDRWEDIYHSFQVMHDWAYENFYVKGE